MKITGAGAVSGFLETSPAITNNHSIVWYEWLLDAPESQYVDIASVFGTLGETY